MPLTPAKKAVLFKVTGDRSTDPNDDDPRAIPIQFNPATLNYSIQNRVEAAGRDAAARQFVAQSTARLDFELQFDSTHDGRDVRAETARIKEFLDPGKPGTEKPAPPVVGFRWGAFSFRGVMESFHETLDFFSSDGVPLRSQLRLSLAAQEADEVFRADPLDATAAGVDPADVRLTALPAGGVADLGSRIGIAGAARAMGQVNGLASLRAGGGVAAVASAGVTLNGAAGFSASAGAGFGVGVGAGAGVSAGFGAGASFGAGAGIGAGAGASFASGASSAGVSASGGAFAGLGVPRPPTLPSAAAFSTGAPPVGAVTAVGLGGRATAGASAGLTGRVGAEARLRFD